MRSELIERHQQALDVGAGDGCAAAADLRTGAFHVSCEGFARGLASGLRGLRQTGWGSGGVSGDCVRGGSLEMLGSCSATICLKVCQ